MQNKLWHEFPHSQTSAAWRLCVDKSFHPILNNGYNYLSMLWLLSIHFSKRDPWSIPYHNPNQCLVGNYAIVEINIWLNICVCYFEPQSFTLILWDLAFSFLVCCKFVASNSPPDPSLYAAFIWLLTQGQVLSQVDGEMPVTSMG